MYNGPYRNTDTVLVKQLKEVSFSTSVVDAWHMLSIGAMNDFRVLKEHYTFKRRLSPSEISHG